MEQSGDAAPKREELPVPAPGDEKALSASAGDSAPPPALPERKWGTAPPAVELPPVYAPNQAIPAFIRALASVFLVAGVTSGIVAWAYNSYLRQRLVQTLQILGQLHQTHLNLFGRIHPSLEASKASLAKAFPPAPAPSTPADKEEGAEVPASPEGSSELEPLLEAAEKEEPKVVYPSPTSQALQPLLDFMRSPEASVTTPAAAARSRSNSSAGSEASSEEAPKDLSLSLIKLSALLAAENPAMSYFGSANSASNNSQKALREAVTSFKSEVRVLKGALLSRRALTS